MSRVAQRARTAKTLAQRLARLQARDLPAMVHASVVIVVVEAGIRRQSPAVVGRRLGCPIATTAVEQGARPFSDDELSEATVRRLRSAQRIAKLWPFSSGPCLRQALVGGHLIRRHKPVVRIGINPSGQHLAGHAWLEIDGRPLENIDRYLVFQDQTPRFAGSSGYQDRDTDT